MKKALIFYGGWAGHEPRAVAERTAAILSDNGFDLIGNEAYTVNVRTALSPACVKAQTVIKSVYDIGR